MKKLTTTTVPELVFQFDDGEAVCVPLESARLTVGSTEASDLRLEHASVSPAHAFLECNDGAWQVADLGSRLGTKVNGRQVRKAWLENGSLISFGSVTGVLRCPPTTAHGENRQARLLNKEIQRLTSEQVNLEAYLLKSQTAASHLIKERDALQADLRQAHSDHHALLAEVCITESKKASMQASLAALEKQERTAREQIHELNSDVLKLEATRSQQETVTGELKRTLEGLQHAHGAETAAMTETRAHLARAQVELQEERGRLAAAVRQTEEQKIAARAELKSLTTEIESQLNDLNALRRENSLAATAYASLRQDNEELRQCTAGLAEVRTKLAQETADHLTLNVRNAELAQQTAAASAELQRLGEAEGALTTSLRLNRETETTLQETLAGLKSEIAVERGRFEEFRRLAGEAESATREARSRMKRILEQESGLADIAAALRTDTTENSVTIDSAVTPSVMPASESSPFVSRQLAREARSQAHTTANEALALKEYNFSIRIRRGQEILRAQKQSMAQLELEESRRRARITELEKHIVELKSKASHAERLNGETHHRLDLKVIGLLQPAPPPPQPAPRRKREHPAQPPGFGDFMRAAAVI